jgi:hypothetical protein
MSDSKDDGSSDVSREKIEELLRRRQELLERSLMPEGMPGGVVPPVDFNYWARQDLWHTIEHGPMLINGYEPVDVQAYWWRPGFQDMLNIQETACTSIKAGRLQEWENPRRFLQWARENGYPVPTKLEELVNRFHPMAVSQTPPATLAELIQERDSLRERVAELEQAAQEAPEKAKPLLTKERQSALKLIIGMAIKGYQYDPAAVRNDATGKISRDIESLGISLDADTVRNWLREAKEALPSKARKT